MFIANEHISNINGNEAITLEAMVLHSLYIAVSIPHTYAFIPPQPFVSKIKASLERNPFLMVYPRLFLSLC